MVDRPERLEDYIVVLDDALPAWLSGRFLRELQSCDHWQPAAIDVDTRNPSVRNCELVNLTELANSGDPRHVMLERNADQLVQRWSMHYEQRFRGVALSARSGIGIIRYGAGGFYHSHTDDHPDQRRVVSVVAVLHNDFTGGALSFFGGRVVFDLQPGSVCLFPSGFQYPHEVCAVESGVRYTLVSWLR